MSAEIRVCAGWKLRLKLNPKFLSYVCRVIAVSRTQALLQETASGYNNIVPIAMDIARLDTAWDLVDIVQREHDAPGPARVRNLCHLASAMYAGPFAKLARTDWQQSIDTMATSRVFLTQALLSNVGLSSR